MAQYPRKLEYVMTSEIDVPAKLLFTQDHIQLQLINMVRQLSPLLHDKCPVVVCVMTGGLRVTADLLSYMPYPLTLDYAHVTRYPAGTPTIAEFPTIYKLPDAKMLRHRTVLIVDDILDEGHTMAKIVQDVRSKEASEVYTAVLCTKDRHRVTKEADFSALTVPDCYVFGYGMDHKGLYRNLPHIYGVIE